MYVCSDADIEALAAEMGMGEQRSDQSDATGDPGDGRPTTDQPSSDKEQDTMATGEAKEKNSASANKGGKKSKKKKKGAIE